MRRVNGTVAKEVGCRAAGGVTMEQVKKLVDPIYDLQGGGREAGGAEAAGGASAGVAQEAEVLHREGQQGEAVGLYLIHISEPTQRYAIPYSGLSL